MGQGKRASPALYLHIDITRAGKKQALWKFWNNAMHDQSNSEGCICGVNSALINHYSSYSSQTGSRVTNAFYLKS